MDISAARTDRGFFSFFDSSDSSKIAAALGLDPQVESNQVVVADILNALLVTGGQQVSSLVLEAGVGLDTYTNWIHQTTMSKPPVLALRIDGPAEQNNSTLPVISPTWGVEQIANNYALTYLELVYDPSEEQALAKKQLVAEVYDFCQNQNTELLLKLTLAGDQFNPEAQLTALQEFRSSTHLLALEVPPDALATATLTAELDIPWIATPGPHQNITQFNDSLAQALENGAQGYLVGETAWADMSQIKRADQAADIDQIKLFINTTFRQRLETFNQMMAEVKQD